VSDSSTDVVDARPATNTAAESPSDSHQGSTSDAPGTADAKTRRKPAGLNGMVLAELQAVASGLGISGTGKLRKGALIEAISAAQNGGSGKNGAAAPAERTERAAPSERPPRGDHSRRPESAAPAVEATSSPQTDTHTVDTPPSTGSGADEGAGGTSPAPSGDRPQRNRDQRPPREQRDRQGGQNQGGQNQGGQNQGGQNQGGQNRGFYDDEDGSGRRRRRGRNRDRRPGVRERGPDRFGGEAEPVIGEDDVLVTVGGIVDVLDNYAFVRTTGYLPGPNDVYITLAQVRKYGLRKGDAVTGAVKQAKDGERRDKFNALVRLDTVNGLEPAAALNRPDFNKLTPLYPQDRLRLESDPTNLTARVIDIVAPIGKGQRGLIVSPPKAGKTMVLQAIANAISLNNPEVHLMVVLVDERPEEVTDMQRSVKGEVIASTFDRPAEDHTVIAELAIERAKRLVELGHDVVVLLDSMTRLGRAYNLAAPASGRILSGGVDSSALYPPKRFFGAARNIEDGGSLTVLATALVETGSKMDDVIFEEFKGTGNMELKLDRRLADKRIFPAVDVDPSGTRKEEILLSPEELKIVWKLRRVLHALDSQQAIELLINKLKETKSNYEFLLQVAKTTPMSGGSED
jgi:transcription termination factor Rho